MKVLTFDQYVKMQFFKVHSYTVKYKPYEKDFAFYIGILLCKSVQMKWCQAKFIHVSQIKLKYQTLYTSVKKA